MIMNFYNEFNKYYDFIFPAGKLQLEFIKERIIGKEILDIACGTGGYSIPLAEEGFNVTSVDLDEGMINALNKKAEDQDLKIKAISGDMKKLDQYFCKESFQTIFCIGNSLVHLTTVEEIKQVLGDIYNLLEKKGCLILQIINYDRILKYNIKQLPTIDNEEAGVSLVRNYINNQEDGLIYFNTELLIKEDELCFENTVALYPLRKSELIQALESVGYAIKELYGSFKQEAHNDEAYATIIVAEK